MYPRNILVAGLISSPEGAKLQTEALIRDNARIDALRNDFETVFSIAQDAPGADDTYHVAMAFNRKGAMQLVKLMSTAQHHHKQLHNICVEYVRLPADFYRPFIIGSRATLECNAGRVLIEFVEVLRKHGKLADGCVVHFARHEMDGRWPAAVRNWQHAFDSPIKYVAAEVNPLYMAGEWTAEDLTYDTTRPYDHRKELHKRTINPQQLKKTVTEPFCQFTIRTPGISRAFLPPRLVAAVSAATQKV